MSNHSSVSFFFLARLLLQSWSRYKSFDQARLKQGESDGTEQTEIMAAMDTDDGAL
jgi:hypothetical protein